jgi:YidC/Oxa1 family membrane protein insertase
MFSYIWHTIFFDPIYNLLVFFIDTVRGGDVGIAIIATIIVVKMVLLPLSISAAKTQKAMREIEPKLQKIKETHKDNREAQAREMMQLYKDHDVKPFASIFLMFLQIPIIFALYFAVSNGGGFPLPDINTGLLYSFVKEPVAITMNFLGLVDITGRSLLLALGAGVAQFFYTKMTLPPLPEKKAGETPTLKEDFMRNMHVQMKYVMPVFIALIAYSLTTAIALYFMVSSLVAIVQEFYIRKHR